MLDLWIISDAHDDTQAVKTACDYIAANAKKNPLIINAGDFLLKPYTPKTLKALEQNDDKAFLEATEQDIAPTLESMIESMGNTGLPFLFVPGNYDPLIDMPNNMHCRKAKIHNATIAGYGGASAWPKHILPLVERGFICPYSEKQLADVLKNTTPDIMLSHTPPLGYCDDLAEELDGMNAGSQTARDYIDHSHYTKPVKLWICGHIHEAGPNGNNPNGTRGFAVSVTPDKAKTVIINPGNLGRFALLNPKTLNTAQKADGTKLDFAFGTFVRVQCDDDGTPLAMTQYAMESKDSKKGSRKLGNVRILRDEIPLNKMPATKLKYTAASAYTDD